VKRSVVAAAVVGLVAGGAAFGGAVAVAARSGGDDGYGTSALVGRAVLPAEIYRPGSAPSGAFFSPSDRATARTNGISVPDTGPALPAQPVQGFSALIPTRTRGEYWALSDNGYGARGNSADFELFVHRVRPHLQQGAAAPGTVDVLGGFALSDPFRKISWRIVCDPTRGSDLPPFDFNVLPATPPALCGPAAQRRLTGFDLDPESVQIARDGTFWFGDEFGPFLLHTDAGGRLLEAPIPVPGARSPQNPFLDVAHGERPTINSSKGMEGLGISPDRRTLYPLIEGAVTGDDPRNLRVYRFDIDRRAFRGYDFYRLELPSTVVNTSVLRLADGSPAYPGDTPPPANLGKNAIGELTVVNAREAVIIERDNGGDYPDPPRFRKVFRIGLSDHARGRVLPKATLIDLMAIPDPDNTGRDGDYFRFPYVTMESIFPTGDRDLLLVNDNNFPFSNGRSFSQGASPGHGLTADPNEFIDVRVRPGLDIDPRILRAPA
jgi:hypothetical protein